MSGSVTRDNKLSVSDAMNLAPLRVTLSISWRIPRVESHDFQSKPTFSAQPTLCVEESEVQNYRILAQMSKKCDKVGGRRRSHAVC